MPPVQQKLTFFIPSKEKLTQPLGKSQQLFKIESSKSTASKMRRMRLLDSRQMILDAGQKNLGAIHCKECGMIYSVDCLNDVKAHEDHHTKSFSRKTFTITKKQIETFENTYPMEFETKYTLDGKQKYVYLTSKSKTSVCSKIMDIIEDIINKELGFSPDITVWGRDDRCTVLVLLVEKGNVWMIASILIREHLSTGTQWNDTGEIFNHEGHKVLGINRIWTNIEMRGKGFAGQLISYDLNNRSRNCKKIAFSEPTVSGEKLAEKLNKSQHYLVYSVSK